MGGSFSMFNLNGYLKEAYADYYDPRQIYMSSILLEVLNERDNQDVS